MVRAALAQALLLLACPHVGAQVLGDRLQLAGESVVFSFQIPASGKTLSLLHSQAAGYLVYRFGSPAGVELEFPARTAESWSRFTYYTYLRPSMGGTNEGLDLSELRFENDGYAYVVYEEQADRVPAPRVGVRIHHREKLLADVAGDPATVVGSLIVFRFDFEGRVPAAAE